MSDDIEVEPIDTSVLDREVEITIRGTVDVVMEVGNAMDLGLDVIEQTEKGAHPGWKACYYTVKPVLNTIGKEIQTDEVMNIPEGIRESDLEDLENALDVDVTWLEEDGDE